MKKPTRKPKSALMKKKNNQERRLVLCSSLKQYSPSLATKCGCLCSFKNKTESRRAMIWLSLLERILVITVRRTRGSKNNSAPQLKPFSNRSKISTACCLESKVKKRQRELQWVSLLQALWRSWATSCSNSDGQSEKEGDYKWRIK